MRTFLVTLSLGLLALAFAVRGDAHLVIHSPKNATLEEQRFAQKRNLAHVRYVCRRGGGEHRRWSCKAKTWLARELAETLAALRPAIPHRPLWLCIHGGEASWTNPGISWDGRRIPWYGGLQMTYRWLGLIPGYAHHLSPDEQMLAAETGYRNSGYSHKWLAGQWPNTYPPCAGLA